MIERAIFSRSVCAGAALLWLAAASASNAKPVSTAPAGVGSGVSIGLQLEPPILDPTASPAAAISEILYGNVYEGLLQFAPDGSVLPKLALSWTVSGDGLTYVFHLRRGVRFHDGSAFDAQVAKFSLERAIAANSLNPQKSRLQPISAVQALDPETLQVRLDRRSGGFLQALCFGSAVMVSPLSAADNSTHPVGTGPFEFRAWRRGDSITLRRSTDYWGTPAALTDVTFKFISDPTAAYAALMAGDVDAFSNYPAPESFPQFEADPRFATFVGSTETETVLSFNERRKPLDDVSVRRALSYALDRKAIIDGAMFGYGIPIGSHFPPSNPAYVDLTGVYPHDVAKAKALLTAAGYGAGFAMTLKLPPPSYARRAGEIVAAQFAQVGVRVSIENLEWAQWLDQVFTRHDYDMSIVGHAEPLDYDVYARDQYYFGYSNPAFKALVAALEDTTDGERRRELLQEIQRKLASDAVNGFLFQYPRLNVWNRNLLGLDIDNVLGVVDLSKAHYDGPARAAGSQHEAGGATLVFVQGGIGAVLATALFLLFHVMRLYGAPYVVRRCALLLATLLAATVVVFFIVQVVPGDPVRFMMGLQADPTALLVLRHELGLDAPAWQRYLQWLGNLTHADFGSSYTYRVPVRALIAERLQVSVPLAAYALVISTAIALPLGLITAARRGHAADTVLSGITQVGLAIPNFWLGLLLVLLFSITLRWTSAGGFPGWEAGLWPGIRALTLPAIALAMPQAAILARVLRGALIDALHEDYIRTARAKGAGEWQVLWHHAFPNALLPVLTILGMQFSFLLAGGVIIENVFFLPGLGRLVFQAIVQRDLIVVQSVIVVLVFAVVSVTFLVELAYAAVNPQLLAGRRV